MNVDENVPIDALFCEIRIW